MIDLVLASEISIVSSRIDCIKFVAEHLRSENPELSSEAKRIRKNIEEDLKEREYHILNKDFSPLNFGEYVERLKSERDLNSIPKELEGPFYLALPF